MFKYLYASCRKKRLKYYSLIGSFSPTIWLVELHYWILIETVTIVVWAKLSADMANGTFYSTFDYLFFEHDSLLDDDDTFTRNVHMIMSYLASYLTCNKINAGSILYQYHHCDHAVVLDIWMTMISYGTWPQVLCVQLNHSQGLNFAMLTLESALNSIYGEKKTQPTGAKDYNNQLSPLMVSTHIWTLFV